MLRAAILPRGPQDETTADIEAHLYGARTGQSSELRAPGSLALGRIATRFVIETKNDPRPGGRMMIEKGENDNDEET